MNSTTSNKSKRKRITSQTTPLFAFHTTPTSTALSCGSRPKRKLKQINRFDPSSQSTAKNTSRTKASCRTGEGFSCPRCGEACSYDWRKCVECGLECYYEPGVGVVTLKERRTVTVSGVCGGNKKGGGKSKRKGERKSKGKKQELITNNGVTMDGSVDFTPAKKTSRKNKAKKMKSRSRNRGEATLELLGRKSSADNRNTSSSSTSAPSTEDEDSILGGLYQDETIELSALGGEEVSIDKKEKTESGDSIDLTQSLAAAATLTALRDSVNIFKTTTTPTIVSTESPEQQTKATGGSSVFSLETTPIFLVNDNGADQNNSDDAAEIALKAVLAINVGTLSSDDLKQKIRLIQKICNGNGSGVMIKITVKSADDDTMVQGSANQGAFNEDEKGENKCCEIETRSAASTSKCTPVGENAKLQDYLKPGLHDPHAIVSPSMDDTTSLRGRLRSKKGTSKEVIHMMPWYATQSELVSSNPTHYCNVPERVSTIAGEVKIEILQKASSSLKNYTSGTIISAEEVEVGSGYYRAYLKDGNLSQRLPGILPDHFQVKQSAYRQNEMVFLNTSDGQCNCHFDRVSSALFLVSGYKEVKIAPPMNVLARPADGILYHIDPFSLNEEDHGEFHWETVHMAPGSVLFIPKYWVHCIRSIGSPNTLAFSFQVELNAGARLAQKNALIALQSTTAAPIVGVAARGDYTAHDIGVSINTAEEPVRKKDEVRCLDHPLKERAKLLKSRNGKRKIKSISTNAHSQTPLFAFQEHSFTSTSSGSRPKRKLKQITRFDPQPTKKSTRKASCRTGEGFACPRCQEVCSYDWRKCVECGLECYYEPGVGVVTLKERPVSIRDRK